MHMPYTAFSPMFAEVSDKVTTIGNIWVLTGLISTACLFLAAWRHRAIFLALPFITLWAIVITSEVRDPYVGPAILSELGQGYITQVYVATVVPVIFVVIGVFKSIFR